MRRLLDDQYHIKRYFWQGTLRVNRYNTYEGWVASESVGQDILISGRVDMNRAFDGDAVAVELLPEEQWTSPAGAVFRIVAVAIQLASMIYLWFPHTRSPLHKETITCCVFATHRTAARQGPGRRHSAAGRGA
jgi:Rrp44-like cold shock domain